VKDEYYGLNNALLGRNKAALDADSPFKDPAFTLQPDVHKTAGMVCTDCHTSAEMHGEGAPTGDDRYAVSTAPTCKDCHGPGQADAASFAAVTLHTSGHVEGMDCQVCHAQPYKNCFGCHTDVTAAGVPFFKNNTGDPTLEARKAAATDPATVFPDALMTFRAGLNPKWTGEGDQENRQYSVLRHAPVDGDTLAYTGDNLVEGLIPDMAGLPTWKKATPHNIVRQTEITKSCTNCHGADYTKFWLTDALGDADGWVLPEHEANEQAANGGIELTEPIPTSAG
jgi:thiosulfate/3-mercaptopyruvate sulfurtransferase